MIALILFASGISRLPVTDRDEARYVQASKQMLESGDYLDIRFQDETRYKKPIGIYWLQVAAHKLLSPLQPALDSIAVYRLPSLLGAMGAVLLLFAVFRPIIGEREATIAALILSCSLITVVEAHLAKTDAMLLLSAMMVMGGLYRLYIGQGALTHWRALFWGGLGLSLLLKGPVIPFIALLTLLCLWFVGKEKGVFAMTKPFPWVIVPVVMVVPWLWFIQTASDGAFVQEAIFVDFLPKLLQGQESHGAPPFYYLLLSPVLLWPSSLIIGLCLPYWRGLATPTSRFMLCWLIPAWVVFELVPTKLPHYILPLVPAIAILTACALPLLRQHYWHPQKRWRSVQIVWVVLWAVITLALALAPSVLLWVDNTQILPVVVVAGVAMLVALGMMLHHVRRQHIQRVLAFSLALSLVTFPVVFSLALPSLVQPWLAREAALIRADVDPLHSRPIGVSGYREPSFVFAMGTDTRQFGQGEYAADFLFANPDALIFVESRHEQGFQAGLLRHGIEASVVTQLSGFNYSRGKPTTLTLYEIAHDRF
jgi:4-amino-4-deoxy-L-arabinose transferase-like glycosyltransferase